MWAPLLQNHGLRRVEVPVDRQAALLLCSRDDLPVKLHDLMHLFVDVYLVMGIAGNRPDHPRISPLVFDFKQLSPKGVLESGVLVPHQNRPCPRILAIGTRGHPQPLVVVAQNIDDDLGWVGLPCLAVPRLAKIP